MVTIWASIVSLPTFVARKRNVPVLLMVAPMTRSPAFLSTGIDSPVTMDSSMLEDPSVIFPSTGIFSPGLTRMMLPTLTFSIGISISSPPRMTRAVLACRCRSFLIASLVCAFALASMYRPRRIRAMMTAAVSKYIVVSIPNFPNIPNIPNTEYPKAALVPMAISVSILAARFFSPDHVA